MNPDRLTRWLARGRVGAEMLQLRDDGEEGPFQRWPVATLPEDPVQLIFDCAGDYADSCGESKRVAIEYLDDEGEVIAKTIHKAGTAEAKSWDAANAANVSENTIISQLLRHIEVQQKVLSGSSLGTFNAMERVLALQSRLVEKQAQQLAQLSDQVMAMRLEQVKADPDEDDPADTEEESRARARALEKVGELLPPVANMALAYMQTRLTNGHAAAGGPVHVDASGVAS